jgi:hypothetical protein
MPSMCWDFPPLRPDRFRSQYGSYPTDNAPPLVVERPKRGYEHSPSSSVDVWLSGALPHFPYILQYCAQAPKQLLLCNDITIMGMYQLHAYYNTGIYKAA